MPAAAMETGGGDEARTSRTRVSIGPLWGFIRQRRRSDGRLVDEHDGCRPDRIDHDSSHTQSGPSCTGIRRPAIRAGQDLEQLRVDRHHRHPPPGTRLYHRPRAPAPRPRRVRGWAACDAAREPSGFHGLSLWTCALMRYSISALFVLAYWRQEPPPKLKRRRPAPGLEDRPPRITRHLGRSLDRATRSRRRSALPGAAGLDPGRRGSGASWRTVRPPQNRPDEASPRARARGPRPRRPWRPFASWGCLRGPARRGTPASPTGSGIDHLSQARRPLSPTCWSHHLGRLYLSTGNRGGDRGVDRDARFASRSSRRAGAAWSRRTALEQWDAAAPLRAAVQFAPATRYRRRLDDALANAGQTGRAIEVLQSSSGCGRGRGRLVSAGDRAERRRLRALDSARRWSS